MVVFGRVLEIAPESQHTVHGGLVDPACSTNLANASTRLRLDQESMPLPGDMPPPPAFFFGSSAIVASVVIRSKATEAAFWIAARDRMVVRRYPCFSSAS